MRVLAYHLHAYALGSVAEEEKLLRNTMDNHLKSVAALDACREAVAPDGSPQAHPWIAPGYLLRGPWIGMIESKHIRIPINFIIYGVGGNGGMNICSS